MAFKTTDLAGRKLTICRASQDGVIGAVKNHLQASMTLGGDTATYWATHVANWSDTPNQGPWLFSATPERTVPLQPNGLGQRFEKLARAAGLPEAIPSAPTSLPKAKSCKPANAYDTATSPPPCANTPTHYLSTTETPSQPSTD